MPPGVHIHKPANPLHPGNVEIHPGGQIGTVTGGPQGSTGVLSAAPTGGTMVTFNDSQRTRVTHHIAPAGGAQVQIVGGLPVFPAAAPAAAPAAFVPTTQKIRGQIAAAEKRCADLADELERYEATLDRLRYEHADAQAAEALEIAQADTWRTEREDQARELAELRAQVEAGRDDAADQEIAALRAELAEQRARNKIERTERTEPPPAPEGLDDDDS